MTPSPRLLNGVFALSMVMLGVAVLCRFLLKPMAAQMLPILIYSLPVLWFLWICCAILGARWSVRRLLVLWLLIDLVVYVVLDLASEVSSKSAGPGGMEYAFVIAFFPLCLPLLLASTISAVSEVVSAIGRGAAFVMLGGAASNALLSDWISFSVLSAIPSACILWIFYYRQGSQMASTGGNDSQVEG